MGDTKVVAAFAAAALVGCVITVLKKLNSWIYEPRNLPGEAQLPPGDMGWPIFGRMLAFLKAFKSTDPDAFIGYYIKKFGKHGLYKTHLFGQATMLSTTPETNKLVLMSDQNAFISGWPTSTKAVMGSHSFAALEGEDHKRLRRLTAPCVNGTENLSAYIRHIENSARIEIAEWAEAKEIVLFTRAKRFAFNVICKAFISYEPGPETDALRIDFDAIVTGIRSMPINLPGTSYHHALMCRKNLVARLSKVIEERETEKNKAGITTKYGDVLEAMMESVDEGQGLTTPEIIDTLLVYLVAGSESSAHTILWFMIMMDRHPDILEKVKAELHEVHEDKKPGEYLTLREIYKLSYLQNVIDEILRLVNISPMIFRKVAEDVEIKGFFIPKGWTVQTWFRAVHLDPEVYPNPLQFDPDRWNTMKLKPGMFSPFGGGYRLCPGKEFARLEISVILYHLTLHYKWEPLEAFARMQYLPHPRPVNGYPLKISRIAD